MEKSIPINQHKKIIVKDENIKNEISFDNIDTANLNFKMLNDSIIAGEIQFKTEGLLFPAFNIQIEKYYLTNIVENIYSYLNLLWYDQISDFINGVLFKNELSFFDLLDGKIDGKIKNLITVNSNITDKINIRIRLNYFTQNDKHYLYCDFIQVIEKK